MSGAERNRLVGIQILRGVAALLVTWHHAIEEAEYSTFAGSLPKWLLLFGASGVDVFFVLSGFIMVYVTFAPGKRTESPFAFFLKRSARIYPFFWFCCLLTLALRGVGLYKSKVIDGESVTRSLLLLPENDLLITASWTLVYEMYFYCIFGIMLLFGSKKAAVVCTSATIVLLNMLSGMVPEQTLAGFLGNEVAFEFCFGLLIGWGFTEARTTRLPEPRVLLAAGLLLIGVASAYLPAQGTGSLDEPWRFLGWGLPASLLVVAAIKYRPPEGAWTDWGVRLGDASYAIYLTHGFLMTAYAKLLRLSPELTERRQWPLVLAVVSLSIAGGYLAHRLIELPLTKVVRATLARALTPRLVGVRR